MQVGRFEVSTGYVGSVWVSYDDDAGRRLIVTDPYGSEDMMKSVGARRLGKPKAFGLQALFRLLYDRTRRKKACNNSSNVRLVLPMVRVDAKTEDEEPIDSMDGLVQRAYQKGTFSLTADELRRVGRHFFDCAAAVERDQAMVLVRSLTSSLFEEKDPMQPTTGALLTALFAERAKPADGSKPAFIADDTKVKIVELTRHWKAAGGRIMYDGQEVRLATDSYSSKNQKRRFSVLEARSGTHPIVKQVSLPPLTFLEK